MPLKVALKIKIEGWKNMQTCLSVHEINVEKVTYEKKKGGGGEMRVLFLNELCSKVA